MAFKLAWALCQQASGAQKVSPRMRDFLVQAVGLAALGTVADVVPLVDENRVLVHHGLESLAACPTLGVATLMHVAKVEAKTARRRKTAAGQRRLAFCLAPRLNAAGRLGQPQLAVELLVTDRPERALELAQYIDQLNATRQTLERSIQLAASKQINEQFDAGRGRRLGPGRARLASGRDRHRRRPAGRQAPPAGRADLLGPTGRAAGHRLGAERPRLQPARALASLRRASAAATAATAMAAGLRIEERQDRRLPRRVLRACRRRDRAASAAADLRIDAEAPLSAFTLQAVHQIERLAPVRRSTTPGRCCAPAGRRWSARRGRSAAAGGTCR